MSPGDLDDDEATRMRCELVEERSDIRDVVENVIRGHDIMDADGIRHVRPAPHDELRLRSASIDGEVCESRQHLLPLIDRRE